MTSLLKLTNLPRLQLLVVMLFLVAGLFPEKSVADEEHASASDAAEGSAPAVPADASGGSSNSTAEGRAAAAITCYHHRCQGPRAKCPLTELNKEKLCDPGHCVSSIIEHLERDEVYVYRNCASEEDDVCIEGCIFFDTKTTDEKKQAEEEAAGKKCRDDFKAKNKAKGRNGDISNSTEVARMSIFDATRKAAVCVCNSKLCNTGTSSGPTGVKHLGCNVALLGALLVCLFPLRSMFLVG